jgi:hypothetical protein
MTVDERIEVLTTDVEPAFRDIHERRELAHKDGQNIRAPARIAEAQRRYPPRLRGASRTNQPGYLESVMMAVSPRDVRAMKPDTLLPHRAAALIHKPD